jgi:hypothetical protein
LRAPDFYFEVMREFVKRFVRIGDLAAITFGIKSGCDAFFMPKDITTDVLKKYGPGIEWQQIPLMRTCKRSEVDRGDLLIIKSGDGTLHPIERTFIRREVHTLMHADRPIIRAADTDRVVLWVSEPLDKLKGTHAYEYLRWGAKQTFTSRKKARARPVPVPQRSTCAARERWYDLTGLEPGIGFWPMAQQYRHFIPANPDALPCNHRMFDIHPWRLGPDENQALLAVLNSTLVSLFKHFYGRYTGTEGSLDTEVFEVLMIEVPDPRNVGEAILRRLKSAFELLQQRETGPLLEENLRACRNARQVREAARQPLELPLELMRSDRRELDDAVFELLGVTDPQRRGQLIDRLYADITLHNRQIRIVEVQKMEQRRRTERDDVSQLELALDAWNALEPELCKPLTTWLEEQTGQAKIVNLPEGEVRLPSASDFFDSTTVYFGRKPALSHVCDNRAEAELLAAVAVEGVRGPVSIPATAEECATLHEHLESRLARARQRLMKLAEERAGSDKLREQVVDTLYRWFVHGKGDDVRKDARAGSTAM